MIKDGSGKGYFAKVDRNNRLWTYSTQRKEIAFISEYNQSAYMVYGKRNFTNAGVDEGILHLLYNGSGSLHIDKITISTNSDICKVELYVGTTYVSGGTAVEAVNLNRASNGNSESTIYNGVGDNLSFSYNDDNELMDIRLSKNTFSFDFEGGLVLGSNNSIGIFGEVASAGDKIRSSVYFYEEMDL